jgi:hypothetical protein
MTDPLASPSTVALMDDQGWLGWFRSLVGRSSYLVAKLRDMAKLSAQGGTVTDHAIKSALEQLQATIGEAKALSERISDPRANSLRNALNAADRVYITILERMKEIAGWEPHNDIDPPVRSIHADESGNIYDRVAFDVRQFPPTIEQLWTPGTWGVIREVLNSLPPPSSVGAERDEQHFPDPDREIRELVKGPLPTTPDKLLAECESLRLRLADGYHTIYLVSSSPEIAHRLWAAMRSIGGVVPPFPELAECDPRAALDDLITAKQQFESVNRALDTVVGWCAARGAESKRQGMPGDQGQAGQGEGKNKSDKPDKPIPADQGERLRESKKETVAIDQADPARSPDDPALLLHKAALACLDAIAGLSGRSIRRDAAIDEVFAELRAAVAMVPRIEEDPFLSTTAVRVHDESATSFHAFIIDKAKDWLKRLPKNMSSASALGQTSCFPALLFRPENMRAELATELQRWRQTQSERTGAQRDQGGAGQGEQDSVQGDDNANRPEVLRNYPRTAKMALKPKCFHRFSGFSDSY